jgi:hypothetical protein
MITFEDLLKAYRSCRIGKVASNAQIIFEMKLGKNLSDLETEIKTRTYHLPVSLRRSVRFVSYGRHPFTDIDWVPVFRRPKS